MKLMVLTTDTKHHRYFINRLESEFDVSGVVFERRRLRKNYATGPFFDQEQDEFEERFFDPTFGGVRRDFSSEIKKNLVEVQSINHVCISSWISSEKFDLGIVFGTGIISPIVFKRFKYGCINIHRGLTQHYRGLDSDLWPIKDDSFDKLGVTVHLIDDDLDTGNIIDQKNFVLEPEDEIYHIRYKTTLISADLVLSILRKGLSVCSKKQEVLGSYKTAMSLEDKIKANEIFENHKNRLKVQGKISK